MNQCPDMIINDVILLSPARQIAPSSVGPGRLLTAGSSLYSPDYHHRLYDHMPRGVDVISDDRAFGGTSWTVNGVVVTSPDRLPRGVSPNVPHCRAHLLSVPPLWRYARERTSTELVRS